MHKLFAALGAIMVGLVVVTLVGEAWPEWARYQQQYLAQLREKTGSPGESPRIKQDWLPALHRTDRCRTCHAGVEDTSFAHAPQPLTTHPAIPRHDFGEFGCTVCHEGQGLATNVYDAHRNARNWGYPLLPAAVREGACGRCHGGLSVDGAPQLSRGRAIIDSLGCIGCHKLPFLPKPSYIGPDLRGIGQKTRSPWLVSWIKSPKQYLPTTIMPDAILTDDQARDIAMFLSATVRPIDDSLEVRATDEMAAAGKLLFGQARCVTCHALDGKGGAIGPDLGRVGDKVRGAWLHVWLSDARGWFSRTKMPHFNFTPREVAELRAYLSTELTNGDYPDAEGIVDSSTDAVNRGKRLVTTLGCAGCHAIPGITDTAREIGPSLEAIGSKVPYQFDFGQSGIERSTANWLFVKLLRPRVFAKGLVMPDYGLSADNALAVTAALMGQSSRDIPESYKREPRTAAMRTLSGPFAAIADKYRCFVCHSIDGAGGSMAPDLTIEGSIARRAWLEGYMAAPDVIRPFLTERMPKLNLTPEEIRVIADYLYVAARHDSIPSPLEWRRSGNASVGKKLYADTYRCQSCHTIGKDGGYYGPPLDNVGARLEPAWVYARLLNAVRYQPDSREPRLVRSEQDALDIMQYLSTLRSRGGPSK